MNVITITQFVIGGGLLLFWILFFTIGLSPKNPPEGYFAYEHSFPLPDIMLSIALITSGILQMQGNTIGKKLGLVCAGALLFLGVLDFSFNIQKGMYIISVSDGILNAFINIVSIAAGVFMIYYL